MLFGKTETCCYTVYRGSARGFVIEYEWKSDKRTDFIKELIG